MVFLANPNNPTGTYITKKKLLELRKKLSNRILFVIDDAYFEYMSNKDYVSGLKIFKSKKNVFILDCIRMLIKNNQSISDDIVSCMYEKLEDN